MSAHSGTPIATANGSTAPSTVSSTLTDAEKALQPALSPATNPVSAGLGFGAAADADLAREAGGSLGDAALDQGGAREEGPEIGAEQ